MRKFRNITAFLLALLGVLALAWLGWWSARGTGPAPAPVTVPAGTLPAAPYAARAFAEWRPGMAWKAKVDYYAMTEVTRDSVPTPKPIAPAFSYTVLMSIAGYDTLAEKECWILQMTVGDDAPPRYRGWNYRLWIAIDDCLPVRLVKSEGEEPITIEVSDYNGIRIIDDVECMAPIYMVPPAPDGIYTSTTQRLKIDVQHRYDAGSVIATEKRSNGWLPMETREVWTAGTPMWRTYEYHSRGELRMKATRLD